MKLCFQLGKSSSTSPLIKIFVSLFNRIQFLRHLKDFFQVMFKIQAQTKDANDDSRTGGESKVLLSCVGVGFTNINKTMT